jgi:PEP-CTERM motif
MRRLTYRAMLAIACLGLCTASAGADLIGINFQGRTDATHSSDALAPGDVAGVIPQNNWNNDPTLVSGGTHTLNQLMDSTGTRTSVSLSVSANDSWFSGSGNADPNHALLNGIIKATAMPATYTFSNLRPGDAYTLIAYTVENDGRAMNNLTVGTTSYFTTAPNGLEFDGTFIRALNTNPAGTRDVGNYVQFDSVTADAAGRLTLTDVWPGGTDGVGIAGIQLQGPAPVPEPASAVLLGLGALALIGIARRRTV